MLENESQSQHRFKGLLAESSSLESGPITLHGKGCKTIRASVSSGWVRKCPCCNRSEFGMGTAVFSLDSDQVEALQHGLEQYLAWADGQPGPAPSNFMIRLPVQSMGVLLSRPQLDDLLRLTRIARRW